MSWDNFKLSVEKNPGLLCFCINSFCDWSRKFAPLSQLFKCKTKTNHDLVANWQIGRFYFKVSLALKDIFLLPDGL